MDNLNINRSNKFIEFIKSEKKKEIDIMLMKLNKLENGYLADVFLEIKDSYFTRGIISFLKENAISIERKGSDKTAKRYQIYSFIFEDTSRLDLRGIEISDVLNKYLFENKLIKVKE